MKFTFIIIIIFLFFIGVSLAENDSMTYQFINIYKLNEDNSAQIIVQNTFSNNNDKIIPFFEKYRYSVPIVSFSKEPIYNYSVYFIGANEKFKRTNNSSITPHEFKVIEKINKISDIQYTHTLIFDINFGGPAPLLPGSSTLLNINFEINNFSYNAEPNYIMYFPEGPNSQLHSETQISSNDILTRIDLPYSPYIWSEYISSTFFPSLIISRETTQSLYWDYPNKKPNRIIYRVNDNPITKQIDDLIGETNFISKQSEKSSNIALGLGIFAFILSMLSFLDINLEKINQYLTLIYGKINSRKKRK